MGVVAIVVSRAVGEPLRDPDGFLGPAWVRLPAMVIGAFVIDVVPRSIWRARRGLGSVAAEARAIVRTHWTRERITAVAIGITSFYVTYVSYRNLKNGLLVFHGETKDQMLHEWDQWLMFGHEPATVLHSLLGETFAAHFLSAIYLIYLPVTPVSVVVWLVWSRNVTYGYWYVTANCLTWALGTASYYAIPSLGPVFHAPWLYRDLDRTGVTELQESLWSGRYTHMFNPFAEGVQSVAGFASLHVGITLVIALVAHYTVHRAWIRWSLWTFFWLTVVSTIYFGWHYIADDIAGAVIAVVAVYLGGVATGQKFTRHGKTSEPTATTSHVPVEAGADRG
jgi:hypothetical protein